MTALDFFFYGLALAGGAFFLGLSLLLVWVIWLLLLGIRERPPP